MSFLSRLGHAAAGAVAGSFLGAPGMLVGGLVGFFSKEVGGCVDKVMGPGAGKGAIIGGFAGAVLGSLIGNPILGGVLGASLGGMIGRGTHCQTEQACAQQCGYPQMQGYGPANGCCAGAYGFPGGGWGCQPQPMPWYPGGGGYPMPTPMPFPGGGAPYPSWGGYPQMPYVPNWGMPQFPPYGGCSHGLGHHHQHGPYQDFHQIPPFPGDPAPCYPQYPHDHRHYCDDHCKPSPVRQRHGNHQVHHGTHHADDINQFAGYGERGKVTQEAVTYGSDDKVRQTRYGTGETRQTADTGWGRDDVSQVRGGSGYSNQVVEAGDGSDKTRQTRYGSGDSTQRVEAGSGHDDTVQTRSGTGYSTQVVRAGEGADETRQNRTGSGGSYQYADGGDGHNRTNQNRSGSGSSYQSARGGENYDHITQNRDGSGQTTQVAHDEGGGATIKQDAGRSGDTRQTATAAEGADITQTGSRYGSTTQTARTGDSPSHITQEAGQGFLGWGWGDKDTTHNVSMGNANDTYKGTGNSESNTFNVRLSGGADQHNIDGKGGQDRINIDLNGEPVWVKDSSGRTIYRSSNWQEGGSVMNTTGVETIAVQDGDRTTEYTQQRRRCGRRYETSWVGTPAA